MLKVARLVPGRRSLKKAMTRRMTVRKLSVWPVVQPEQCKLGTFSTAAASATAGRSALIGTRHVRIRGPYFHIPSFHDIRLGCNVHCALVAIAAAD